MGYSRYGGYQAPKRQPRPKPDPVGRKIAAAMARSCTYRVEGDEAACHCGLRWPMVEARPPCPQKKDTVND